MPRDARVIPDMGYMHIISRGNNRRKIFLHNRDKKKLYSHLIYCRKDDKIDICHYCIMDNHLHLLVKLKKESGISRFMKRINLKYIYHYRRNHDYVGHLWQGRFKSKIINSDEYLIQCGKYIELNPVRSGKVKLPEDYKFSSYCFYAFGSKDKLIAENPLYQILGNTATKRQTNYKEMVIGEIS